tara:strand:+ start:73616 stop:74074 length:459 start_codon:yes stop_codon:yes gene_type:complete
MGFDNNNDYDFSNPHKILDGYESLERHHLAKEDLRHAQLDLIPVSKNDRVLDIGIGPGFYLPHWLKSTTDKNVTFDLFDISEEALAIAINKVENSPRVNPIVGDFSRLSTYRKRFRFHCYKSRIAGRKLLSFYCRIQWPHYRKPKAVSGATS